MRRSISCLLAAFAAALLHTVLFIAVIAAQVDVRANDPATDHPAGES